MIETISTRCPNCGAELQIEKNREVAYCTYCGMKLLLDNSQERVFRYIDDAKIKQAEVEREIRLRELELKEKSAKHRRIFIWIWVIASIILAIPGTIGVIIKDEELQTCLWISIILLVYGVLFLLIRSVDDKKENNDLNYTRRDSSQQYTKEFQKISDSITNVFKEAFSMLFKK